MCLDGWVFEVALPGGQFIYLGKRFALSGRTGVGWGGGGKETMQSLNQLLVTPTVWVPFFNAAVFLDKSEAMYGMGAQTRPLYNYQL